MNKRLYLTLFLLLLVAACTSSRPEATNTPGSTGGVLDPSSTTHSPSKSSTITPQPGLGPAQPPAGLRREPVPPEALETKRLLESAGTPARDMIDLTKRLDDPGRLIPQVVRDKPWEIDLGETHDFWVLNWDTHEYSLVEARLVYETPHTRSFVEEGINLDEGQLKRLMDRFDEQTYPNTRAFFGEEWSPGVDNDPHLTILFSNKMGNIVSGYQRSMDEYSRLVDKNSNEMEMIYVSPGGGWWNDDCMLAHEFEHVIQWANDPDEETWLNEGISMMACQLNNLQIAGIEEALETFARRPDTQLNSWGGEASQALADYAASYMFLRYLSDHFGEQSLRALVSAQKNGLESVDDLLISVGADFGADDLFADWIVANFISDINLAGGQYGYFSLIPPTMDAEVDYFEHDLPIDRQTNVHQYGTNYIALHGPGKFIIDFVGATVVGLAPISAQSGKYLWWGGNGTNGDSTLTREFDLTGLKEATLTFNTWYDIEEGFDYAYVEVSVDGRHWAPLPGQTTTNDDLGGSNYGNGYTGASGNWVQEEINLTPFVGQKVQIRFEYVTDDGPVHAGFFLDEIEISELDYKHDAESSDGGWIARGFIRQTNMLPQEWLLELVTLRYDETTVDRLQLGPGNTGRWSVDLDSDEMAVLVVSGLTRGTTEPAGYWYSIDSSDE